MTDERPVITTDNCADEENDLDKTKLELYFIVAIGTIVAAAIISALSYELISSRTPLVIMAPLMILIGVQFVRVKKACRNVGVSSGLSLAAGGDNRKFNIVAGFIGWMVLLLTLIIVAGHYIGIAVLLFILLRMVSKEALLLSLALTVGVTAAIFTLFELGFDIELHRGAIFRMLAGYAAL